MLKIIQTYKTFAAEGSFLELAEKALASAAVNNEQQTRTALAQELEALTASASKIPTNFDREPVYAAMQRVIAKINALNQQG